MFFPSLERVPYIYRTFDGSLTQSLDEVCRKDDQGSGVLCPGYSGFHGGREGRQGEDRGGHI